MTTKIDELNTRYLIPGSELGTTAMADPDGAEDDYGDAPYSQMPAMTDMPSPNGWQDLLDLNRISPDPSQIDPPPRPTSLEKGTAADAIDASQPSLGSLSGNGTVAVSTSPKVQRMIGMLAGYDLMVRRIRARASEGGGQ
jgi:hypothetical protein